LRDFGAVHYPQAPCIIRKPSEKACHMRHEGNLKHLFDTDEEPTAAPARKPAKNADGVISQLRDDLGELIDMEKAVAKLELSYKAIELKRDLVGYGLAATLSALGATCVVYAFLLLLGMLMPTWVAALLLGCVLMGAGVLTAVKFRSNTKRFRELLSSTPATEDESASTKTGQRSQA
jgi:hypothetical protein